MCLWDFPMVSDNEFEFTDLELKTSLNWFDVVYI